MFRRVFIAPLLVGTCLVACGSAPQEPPPPPPQAHVVLVPSINDLASTHEDIVWQAGFSHWLDAYVASRIVPVAPNPRDPIAYGPWSARSEPGTSDASDDGSLTEWADNYYITHDWSEYGQQILTMQPGDSVTINDKTIVVEGIFNYPKDSYYEEILMYVGKDALVIQTCYPNSDENRIVYGRPANNVV